ncbi:eukaryotic translation initiation factor 4 gamma 3 isoform X2 [Drosophila kikkawai]|uniref:Eukaryotic translation initiation factor 4 gamma 3 isoform X2 n=1 Tax=Drosophila kikkawai TaxID=30033 RepID=A0ABM4GMB1_DROKI|nr:eukaryotic translation initiation factor 4 gamma 3 isoform X2 [Drosophila kikkawai]
MQQLLTSISTQSDINKVMQPHSAQNMTGGGGIFRGPQQQPSSSVNALRGGGVSGGATRHVHVQPMYSQAALHQNMVLQPYTQYNPRQQTFPTSHLQYAPTPMPYYQYQYVPTLQQQPPPPPQHTHPRSAAVSVNSNNNTLQAAQVQQQQQQSGGNPGGGPGGTQSSQIQLLAGTVQGPGGNMSQVGVGVAPMVGVGVMSQSVVAPQPVQVQVQQSNRRRHQHRLPIIDPTTKKNILEDLDKSNSNTENDFSNEQQTAATTAAVLTEAHIARIPQQDGGVGIIHQHNLSNLPALGSNDIRTNAQPYNVPMEPITIQRPDAVGQTPIVSAMSDAPSVEILPTPQKTRSKKIPIVPPKNVSDSTSALPTTETEDVAESKAREQPTKQNLINAKFIAVEEKQSASILAANTQITTDNVVTPVGSLEAALVAPETTSSEFLTEEKNLSTEEELLAKNIHESEIKKSNEVENPTEVLKDYTLHSEPTVFVDIGEEKKCLDKNTSEEEQSDETDLSEVSSMAVKEVVLPLQEKVQAVESSENTVKAAQEQLETPVDTPSEKSYSPENDSVEVNINPCSEEKEKISSSFINYNEGQWSPSNPDGKKQYNREQLMQLREAKASRIQPEVKNVSILPQPNLMPSFIRNNNNKRVQSMVGMIGNRESSAGGYMGKQLSMSGVHGQSQGSGGRNSSMKGMMIHVNLSLNQDVKLNENENAWRPRLLNKSSATETDSNLKATQEKDDLVRRVRGILNKLTPERFDTLVEEIIKLKIDTPDKMDEVIVLVFEKAIDEPNFSVSYARLCHRLISEVKARDERMESGTKSNLAHFRNALLDKTEREFTQNVSQSTAKEKKLQPIVDKIRKCSDPNEKAELEAFLEEEERKIRRRSGGTVRFIGELFKISMLTGKIIYSCIDTLLNPHSEDMLECLCKLLTTVGAKFEQTPVNSKDPGRCYSLEKSISRMQAIAAKTDKDGAKVSSRVRFMLQDVIDLRKNKWQTTRNEAPKTMGQIEKEAKNEQLTAQYFGNISGNSTSIGPSQSGASSNKRDDRNLNSRYGNETRSGSNYGGSHSQRGHHQQQSNAGGGGVGGGGSGGASNGGNNDDNTWHVQTSKGSRSQAVDSNKLEGLSKLSDQNLETKKMGGLTQFIWNNNTRQSSSSAASAVPSSTPSNPFAVLSSLIDKNSSSSDRDRDRDHHHDHRGPRNKGSYSKGSMERDRYDRGINSRTGSSQGSRESSSSRQQGGGRSLMNSAVQKSASHTKYTQQQLPTSVRHNTSNKVQSNSGSNAERGIYRGASNEQGSGLVATPATTFPQQSNRTAVSAPPAVFQEASDADLKLTKSVVSEMIELADAAKTVTPAVVECMKRIPEDRRCGFLYYILTDYLHLANVGKQSRRYLGITVTQLIQHNYISVEHFTLAYNEFSEYANDLIVDIPELWLYILQFAGPLIVKKVLTVSDLWNKNLKDNSPSSVAKKFLKTYLIYCTHEVGPNFTRSMWTKFSLHWSDFMPENEVNDFIKSNRLEYVENESISPVIEHRGESTEKHVKNVIEHIEHLLKEGTTADCIIDYSNGNIMVVDKLFIRSLTESLSNFSILYKENSYKLETETFQKFCIPVLQRYIDSNEDHQLECLYAMQLLVHSLEHPRGLLSELFGELYDAYVIQKESLCKWRDSKDQSAGKGVAVKSLNPFFNSLFNDEVN